MKALNINIPGLTIACKLWGNPSHPPVLALHGWLDNANSFDHLAELLQNNYHIIAVDLPGHGHSSHLPAGCNYHFTDGIFIIIQIMDALKLDKVHLLGHSMGACLGSLVAGVAPDRFLSLSLIEGLGPFSHPGETACRQLSDYLQYVTQAPIKPSKGYKESNNAALARAMKGYVSIEIAKRLVERGLVEEQGVYYWRHDRRLLVPSPLRMTEAQILSCLKEITVNSLLIWANKGISFNNELIQERVKAVKHLKVERLEGGHHIHMEQPQAVAQLLAEFYQSAKQD